MRNFNVKALFSLEILIIHLRISPLSSLSHTNSCLLFQYDELISKCWFGMIQISLFSFTQRALKGTLQVKKNPTNSVDYFGKCNI